MLTEYSKELRWSYIGAAIIGGFQFVTTGIMARLLTPADFGIMAVVMVIFRALGYFAQFGVARAIVQKKDLQEYEVRGSFSISMLCGIVCAAVMFAGAPIFARFYHQAQATSGMRLFSLVFLLQAVAITPSALLRRRMQIKTLALLEAGAFLVGQFVFGIPAAYFGAGFWAIVFSIIGQSLVLAVGSFSAAPHSLMPEMNIRRIRQVVVFGGKASGVSVVEFMNASTDTFVLGRFASATGLGLYNRAFMLINLPLQYVSNGLQKVLFPAFAREQNDLQTMRLFTLDAARAFAALIIPIGVGAALSSRVIILVVLGSKWSEATTVLQWLCVAAIFNCLVHVPLVLTEALGRFAGRFASQTIVLVAMSIAVYIGALHGIIGAALGVATVECLRCLLLFVVTVRLLKCPPLTLARAWVPGAQAGLITGLVASLIDHWSRAAEFNPIVSLLTAVAGCGAVALGFYATVYPREILLPLSAVCGSKVERFVRRVAIPRLSAASIKN